jgi:sugar/nucleoside kinase (ribokinase family)
MAGKREVKMAGKDIDVVVIGHIIKETIRFPDKEIGPVIGSPAAYSSLVMAAQGMSVGLVTYYGGDMDDIISELDVLDQKGILRHSHSTTNLLVYREDGTKYVEFQKVAPHIAFDNICPDYLTAEYFKICPMNYEVELEVVEKLHGIGKKVFVDLGGYGGATSDIRHSIYTDYGKEVIGRICRNSSIVKASNEDLVSIMPDKTTEEAANYLLEEGAANVVVTLGSNGAMFLSGNASFAYVEPADAVSENSDGTFDRTGAGDAFGAGFMVSYVKKQDMLTAVRNGNATASLVIQRSGGCTFRRMPSRERVECRVKETLLSGTISKPGQF